MNGSVGESHCEETSFRHDISSTVSFLTLPCFDCTLAVLAGNSSVGSFCASESSEAPI